MNSYNVTPLHVRDLKQYTAPDDHIEPMINRFEPAYDKEVDDRTVFVGNLDTRIGHNEVRAFFGGQGLVKRVDVKKGLTRAVANVEMRHPGDLPRVLRHNGVRLNGRILSVYPKVFHVRRQTEEPHRILGDALAGLRRLAN